MFGHNNKTVFAESAIRPFDFADGEFVLAASSNSPCINYVMLLVDSL